MSRVLIITTILPIPTIDLKKNENDILLVIENEIKKRDSTITFDYIFIFPYTNRILAQISKKWKSYYNLKKTKSINLNGRNISIFPVIMLPRTALFRNVLIRLSIFMNKKRLNNILKDFNPTVIHAQDAVASAYISQQLSKKHKIPFIVTLREINHHFDTKVKKTLNSSSAVVAISEQQISEGKKLTSKEIILIPHGTEERFYSETTQTSSNNQTLRLITVSRLIKLKNIDLVIKTLSQFDQDFIYDIYGEGLEMDTLNELISNLGMKDKIFLKGFISNTELPSILKNYNLFVMPSYPEALGRVYFEAMASGLPVIAAKNTGIDGIITHEKEGFLLNPLNESEFSEKLLKIFKEIVENPEKLERMSKASRTFAETYSWDAIVPKYISLYHK